MRMNIKSLVVLAAIACAGCEADGGFPGGGAGGGGGGGDNPDEQPENPDVSGWTPVQRGAASIMIETSCSPLSTCTVTDPANAADGDGETAASLAITGGGGDSFVATYDVGAKGVSDTGVAAVEISSEASLSTGYSVDVSTFLLGEPVEEGCGSATELDTGAGTGGAVLVGCKNSEPYDQIVATFTFNALSVDGAVMLIDVVTAAQPPAEE